jgi:hypothetical protein
MFHEIKTKTTGPGMEKVGGSFVAKESRYIEDEQSKEKFHTVFCRVQNKANEFAKKFNQAVKEATMLRPSENEVSLPPRIIFLKCSIYEYTFSGKRCGLLVERFLQGKFVKFNSNNGFVLNSRDCDGATIDLVIGEVLLTDFVQAFSHWVYEFTDHKMIVCDLQGILDMEGRWPIFRLTDPAICSKRKKEKRYGKTDLGLQGVRSFCLRHTCSGVCKALNLPCLGRKVAPRESQRK